MIMRENIKIKSYRIKTINDYNSVLEKISKNNKDEKLWYRGQMDSKWRLGRS